MKILLAPDKFKGSLTALEVCQALERGLKEANPELEIVHKPLADGGDGSLAVLDSYLEYQTITVPTQDPLFREISATYRLSQQTAYIELAEASGLVLLTPAERNPMHTSTYGTGLLIADAIQRGAREIYLFIGGSSSNDGAIGIATALGYQFFDANNNPLKPIGKNLSQIQKIDASQVHIDFKKIKFKVICDVDNPFYGKNGAAHIYAAQKGANTQEIAELNQGLLQLAQQLKAHAYADIADVSGAGAAGGTGGGTMAFLQAELISGTDTFFAITNFENALKDCDLVITGEGKIDRQTESGKVVSGVVQLAEKYNKPVIAVCGVAEAGIEELLHLSKIYSVLERSKSVEEAMKHAREKVEEIGREIIS